MKALYWFRSDLRVADNLNLLLAIQEGVQLTFVHVLEDRNWIAAAPWRRKFILESVVALRERLRALGSDLVLLRGKADERITELCREVGTDTVFAMREPAFDEQRIERILTDRGLNLKLGWDGFLLHPDDHKEWPDKLPDVFTAFRNKAEKNLTVWPVAREPRSILNTSAISVWEWPEDGDATLELEPDPRSAVPFRGGESEASRRLHNYLWGSDAVATYFDTRNELIGTEYSTKLSAWLALGCISPRQIFVELKHYEQLRAANKSTYWVVFELLWRDYFRYVTLRHGSAIFSRNGFNGKKSIVPPDAEKLGAWKQGRTGDAFVDANMRELLATGFMSNRGRQNVASYLVHDLQQDWREGAEWFEQQLIDYDPCSNWCNWAYLAGVGNDPRPDRRFNTERQAEMYDVDRAYRTLWAQ